METTRYSVKVKLSIRVMKLVESLIGFEVSVTGQGSKCHLTLVRGKIEKVPRGIQEGDFILLDQISAATIKLPE